MVSLIYHTGEKTEQGEKNYKQKQQTFSFSCSLDKHTLVLWLLYVSTYIGLGRRIAEVSGQTWEGSFLFH